MKRLIPAIALCLLAPVAALSQASADSGWVNSQEGCWCGYQTQIVRPYKAVGKSTSQADRQAGGDMINEWNRFTTLFDVQVSPTETLGAPSNGINEINILISSADAQSIYGFSMDGNLYGRGVIEPGASFGNFNECKDFNPAGCGPFTQTDVVMNAGFASGWTGNWYSDAGGQNPALIQTTAVHEVGHTLGLHHVFTLPAFGDSFSTMNYANDDSMKWVTRMDAKTIRQQYSTRVNSFTDVAIFPFTYGNGQYAETYASLSASSVQPGGSVNLQNWLIQNVGTAAASNVVVTFYLVPAGTRMYPEPTDVAIGTATFASVAADSEADQASTPLTIPQSVANGDYNVGAIVTVNGAEDTPFVAGKPPNNNRFLIGHGTKIVLTVGSGNDCQGATPLSNGIALPDYVYYGYANYYCFQVPAGATNLLITTTNADDDVDLYVKLGQPPTYSDNDCASNGPTGSETCSEASPPAGLYFIAIDGSYIAGYMANYTLTAYFTPPATCTLTCTASATPTSGNAPLSVSFAATATATSCSGSPSYTWNFGDSQVSTLQNPLHTYSAAGTYNYILIVEVPGSTQCTKTGTITVTAPPACSLTCIATVPSTGTAGTAVSFGATAIPSNCTGAPAYSWAFGDGQTSTSQNASHTYVSAGTYSWSLTVTVDAQTCTKSGSIAISGGGTCTVTCTASATPTSGTAPLAVTFTATATPSNCTGSPSYSWTFGDGATSTQQNPSHTFATSGTFNWSLTVSVGGQTCSKSGSITVTGGGTRTFAIGTRSGAAGSNLCVDITLDNGGGAAVITAFTTDITYDTSKLTPTGVTTPVGNKLIGGNVIAAGTYRITLYGGTGTLSNGAVASVCFGTTAGQCATHTLAHASGSPTASDANAADVPVTGTAGSITTTGCAAGRTLAIGTKSGTAGSSVCVDVTLDNGGAAAIITAFTTDLTYDASKLTPTGVTTPVGNKLIGGNVITAGTYRITLYGGTGTLSNGAVASVCFGTTAGQCAIYPLAHAAGTPTASDASANPVPISGTAGAITTTGCGGAKPGDCNGDGTVSIGEVQKAINMFLGTLAPDCGVDCNGDVTVSIGEVQKVINAFLGIASSCS